MPGPAQYRHIVSTYLFEFVKILQEMRCISFSKQYCFWGSPDFEDDMKQLTFISLVGFATLLSGCDVQPYGTPYNVGTPYTIPGAQPATPVAAPVVAPTTQASVGSDVRIAQFSVTVPRELRVSEADLLLPTGDIVWHGDPPGDRYAQVQAIFEDAFSQTVSRFDGRRRVRVDVRVTRFHGLTQRARRSIGGVHNIEFDIAVRDARTGDILIEPRHVIADLTALGGEAARAAELRGQTQKVRITNFLAEVLRQELTQPGGHQTADLGLYQSHRLSL